MVLRGKRSFVWSLYKQRWQNKNTWTRFSGSAIRVLRTTTGVIRGETRRTKVRPMEVTQEVPNLLL